MTNTDWHNIVLWRQLAEVAGKYVKKGSQIYIEGRIKTRSYDDKDGVKKYITDIVGDTMKLLGRKPDDAGSSASASAPSSAPEPKAQQETDIYVQGTNAGDDLPF